MRLDKFLKVSRIIRRRTVARKMCEAERVRVNGRVGKPGSDISPGDRLEIRFSGRRMEAEVLSTPEAIRAGDAATTYRILSLEPTGEPDPF